MIQFLKKHVISLVLLFISGIVGIALVFLQTPKDSWIVEYVFDTKSTELLPSFAKADTVFLFEGILIRNYTSSIGDTLRSRSLSVYEIKVNIPAPSTKERVLDVSSRILKNDLIEIKDVRYRETQRDKAVFLYCVLFGFFLGMVVEFVGRLKQHPNSAENG